jgi:hypothetical protein
VENVADRIMNREEALNLSGRLEPLQAPST